MSKGTPPNTSEAMPPSGKRFVLGWARLIVLGVSAVGGIIVEKPDWLDRAGEVLGTFVEKRVMVCAGHNCSGDSVTAAERDGVIVLNFTTGQQGYIAVPGFSSALNLWKFYSCAVTGNSDFVKGYGSLAIRPWEKGFALTTAVDNPPAAHIPVTIQGLYVMKFLTFKDAYRDTVMCTLPGKASEKK